MTIGFHTAPCSKQWSLRCHKRTWIIFRMRWRACLTDTEHMKADSAQVMLAAHNRWCHGSSGSFTAQLTEANYCRSNELRGQAAKSLAARCRGRQSVLTAGQGVQSFWLMSLTLRRTESGNCLYSPFPNWQPYLYTEAEASRTYTQAMHSSHQRLQSALLLRSRLRSK